MLTILWLLPTILWEQKKTQIKKKKRNEEKNRNQVWNLNTEVWYLHKKVDKAKNEVHRHYKIFCVNVKYGIQYGFRIFYLIALQNEENYEREESCSAWWGIK